MPNCDFYASRSDRVDVLDFVFAQPGWRLVELASRHDQPLRTFTTTREVVDGFPTFDSMAESLHFHLYAESMGGRIGVRRVDFKPGAVRGASFRFGSQGWGLIQLYFGQLRDGRLRNCHTNHSTEKRAQAFAPVYGADPGFGPALAGVDSWDWKEVTRISSRLNRFIRRRAAGKLHSRAVMPAAWTAHMNGDIELAFP